jgi:hypothetical protein
MTTYRIIEAHCQAWVPLDVEPEDGSRLAHRCNLLGKEVAIGEPVLCMEHAVELQSKGSLRIIVRENNWLQERILVEDK